MYRILKLVSRFLDQISFCFYFVILSPHIFLLSRHKNKTVIWQDINRFREDYRLNISGFKLFVYLMKNVPCYRNVFYLRVKPYSKLLGIYFPKDKALIIEVGELLGGLVFHHPFSTIINAKYIGANCTIRHSTTLGNKNSDQNQRPTILDNVNIGAGSIIIGNVKIGNNCVIGAGSVVVKDVPDNCVAAGNPAKIIYRDGIRI